MILNINGGDCQKRSSRLPQLLHVMLASLALGTVLVTSTQTAWSQANTATFYGTITDPSGAVIPGANVKLTKQDTQATLTKTASSSGDFAFTFVPVGVYTLNIDAEGLSHSRARESRLLPDNRYDKRSLWN